MLFSRLINNFSWGGFIKSVFTCHLCVCVYRYLFFGSWFKWKWTMSIWFSFHDSDTKAFIRRVSPSQLSHRRILINENFMNIKFYVIFYLYVWIFVFLLCSDKPQTWKIINTFVINPKKCDIYVCCRSFFNWFLINMATLI